MTVTENTAQTDVSFSLPKWSVLGSGTLGSLGLRLLTDTVSLDLLLLLSALRLPGRAKHVSWPSKLYMSNTAGLCTLLASSFRCSWYPLRYCRECDTGHSPLINTHHGKVCVNESSQLLTRQCSEGLFIFLFPCMKIWSFCMPSSL